MLSTNDVLELDTWHIIMATPRPFYVVVAEDEDEDVVSAYATPYGLRLA